MKLEIQKLQSLIDALLEKKDNIQALEAGCGSTQYIKFQQSTHMTGIDVSQEQLEKNTYLDEKIHGDIQEYPLPKDHFDAIVCWNVLEHLKHPKKALDNFTHALKKQGILVLAFPNFFSLKGMITKFTPHWFHVWLYQSILGYENAGEKGEFPFKTFLRFAISPSMIKKYAQKNKLSIEYFQLYGGRKIEKSIAKKSKWFGFVLSFFEKIIPVLTLGLLSGKNTDCFVVLQK